MTTLLSSPTAPGVPAMLAPTVPLADPNPPLMDEIRVLRVRDGKEVSEALWVEWHAPYAMLPGVVVIARGWDGRTWEEWDRYEVGGVRKAGTVLTVRLVRDERKVMETPPGGDRAPEYEVSVVDGSGWCGCRGHIFRDDPRAECKHSAAVRHLVEAGVLSEAADV